MKALNTYINEKLILNKDTFKDNTEFKVKDYNDYCKTFKNFKGYIYSSVNNINNILGDPMDSHSYIWCREYKDIVFIIQPLVGAKPKSKNKKTTFKLWTANNKDTLDIIDILNSKGIEAEIYR